MLVFLLKNSNTRDLNYIVLYNMIVTLTKISSFQLTDYAPPTCFRSKVRRGMIFFFF